ncbi:hypothetical protein XH98_14720 [Bradyrhizobium sp. CCBAU 51745]|nr:hypothetical protein [Bradyrhizobium sp. CCBAU 51745]
MNAAYAALTARYPWFLHIKPVRKFDRIKHQGLEPRSQGCPTNTTVSKAIGDLVKNVDEMIFFRPIGTFDSTPRRGEKMFMTAISRSSLPEVITVDWTFGGTWGLASIIKKDTPSLSTDAIFCEVVRRRGSVATYRAIPPNLLHVWVKGQPAQDPSKWPLLIDIDVADVVVFE